MKIIYQVLTSFLIIFCLFDIVLGKVGRRLNEVKVSETQYDYSFNVSAKLRNYKLSFIVSDCRDCFQSSKIVIRVEVRRVGSNRILQRLKLPGSDEPFSFYARGQDTMDLNFDGYTDFLMGMPSGSGGSQYCVWLFNPHTGKYEYSESFSDITSPSVDWRTKTVLSNWQNGSSNGGTDFYRVKNDSLILYKSEEIQFNDKKNRWEKTIKYYSANNKIVSEEIVPSNDKGE